MNDHEDALKFMIKSRISFLHKNIDKASVGQIAESLGHLLSDINAVINGLPEGK